MLFLLITVFPGLKSQSLFNNAEGERLQACTDRTLYVTGEKVHFSVVVFNVREFPPEELSRVFYCQLITPEGNMIAGGKYLLKNFSGQGCLIIPDETISGIYYLKFYTRVMRNITPDKYKYIMLKIINPFKTEVLPGKNVLDTAELTGNKMEINAVDQSLIIVPDKKTFSLREEIRLRIGGDTGKRFPARLCLSVIPESTYKDQFVQVTNNSDSTKNILYFPEIRGISLSGQLIGKESGKPVPNTKVNLSIIGDRDILVVRTDSAGRFFFTLPDYIGNKDIFLCADDLPDITPEILIDNDFCSRPVHLPSPVFNLNEEEMKTAYKLAVNYRVRSVFREDTISADFSGEKNIAAFYGEPSEMLVIDKYIDLPTLEDYFTELPVLVKLRKVQNRKQFRFYNEQAEMSIFEPLILVDWVAVNDINKILAMSPTDIERIELISSPYVKGNIVYGGIISFVSKKNDFAGIDLPKSGTFVNYTFLGNCYEDNPPGPANVNIPDSRNTVYWNPSVKTDNDGNVVISFTAPDTPGRYHILLREMTRTGEVVLKEEMIIVTDN